MVYRTNSSQARSTPCRLGQGVPDEQRPGEFDHTEQQHEKQCGYQGKFDDVQAFLTVFHIALMVLVAVKVKGLGSAEPNKPRIPVKGFPGKKVNV